MKKRTILLMALTLGGVTASIPAKAGMSDYVARQAKGVAASAYPKEARVFESRLKQIHDQCLAAEAMESDKSEEAKKQAMRLILADIENTMKHFTTLTSGHWMMTSAVQEYLRQSYVDISSLVVQKRYEEAASRIRPFLNQ